MPELRPCVGAAAAWGGAAAWSRHLWWHRSAGWVYNGSILTLLNTARWWLWGECGLWHEVFQIWWGGCAARALDGNEPRGRPPRGSWTAEGGAATWARHGGRVEVRGR